ncbi:hypothetical protein BH23VER1_BH23VER1_01200 [soil metagenome]
MSASGIVLDPVFPVPLVVILGAVIVAVTAWAYRRSGSRVSVPRRWFLLSLRLAATVLLVLILLRPSVREPLPPRHVNAVTVVAIDDSASMGETDVEKASRLDAARATLYDSGVLSHPDQVALFAIGEEARRLGDAAAVDSLSPDGETTRIHHSVRGILEGVAGGLSVNAIVMLTDGHDFDLVNPGQTAALARQRNIPIYAMPFGAAGNARDIAVRNGSYPPYTYIGQRARVGALVRLVGVEHETLTAQLLRGGKVVETKQVPAGEAAEVVVDFEVTEEAVGQFEYEIRVVPLRGETSSDNNSTVSFLNVIEEKIRVLVLEGQPYWDTTFLQRALSRNEKVELEAVVQYQPGTARTIRNTEARGEMEIPRTAKDFASYAIVILGRKVDALLDPDAIEALRDYTRDGGGTVVFARGRAWEADVARDLEPVAWDAGGQGDLQLEVATAGRTLAPFQILRAFPGGLGELPELLAARSVEAPKTLAATLADASGIASGLKVPGIVHRRFGRGQTLSVGVDGLWKWALNAKVDAGEPVFDRFWDSTVLWLLANSDHAFGDRAALRPSASAVLLGEKVFFRLEGGDGFAPSNATPAVSVSDDRGGSESVALTFDEERESWSASFVPQATGRYTAELAGPGGEPLRTRFVVYEEKFELSEVAVDIAYLRNLCEASGGRLLESDGLSKLVRTLAQPAAAADTESVTRSIWDRPGWFYLIVSLLALDWFLRRRWGLA